MEIERKFLPDMEHLPFQPEDYPCRQIEQGYLCTEPVVRIRRDNDKYFLTYKSKGLMVREEYNLPLTKPGYEHLLAKADGRIITKKRYVIPLEDDLKLELDISHGNTSFYRKLQKFSIIISIFPVNKALCNRMSNLSV